VDLNDEDLPEYCRQVEAYLCRKNDGHLIRIVGPAFEQVCGWAARGVPLKVAHRGIDRYFERYYAKGPRRRPIRIEFCEADVLDVFDEWRRATGIGRIAGDAEEPGGEHKRPHASLPAHLERVVARLTTLRGGADRALDETIDAVVRELETARSAAKAIRGEARSRLLARLRELDAGLIAVARECCADAALAALVAEAETELAPFRQRMPSDAYEQARHACVDRLLRERSRLPTIAFE
jgi:hypothetical protein